MVAAVLIQLRPSSNEEERIALSRGVFACLNLVVTLLLSIFHLEAGMCVQMGVLRGGVDSGVYSVVTSAYAHFFF